MKSKTRKFFNFVLIGNVLSMVIPVFIAGHFIYSSLYDHTKKEQIEKNIIITETMANQIETVLNEPYHVLEDIVVFTKGIPNKQLQETPYESLIKIISTEHGFFNRIEILDDSGRIIFSTHHEDKLIGKSRIGQDYYEKLHNGNQDKYWSQIFISDITNKPTLTMSIKSGGRIVVGYFILDFLDEVSKKFKEEYGETFSIAITDVNGIYLSHIDQMLVDQRRRDVNFTTIKDNFPAEKSFSNLVYSGIKMQTSVAMINNTQWYVIMYESNSLFYARISEMLWIILLLWFSTLVFSIIFTIIKFKNLSETFSGFNLQAERIANGNFSEKLEQQKFEEFNQFAVNFNLMLDNVKKRDAELTKMVYTDKLTGLFNRAYIFMFIRKCIIENPKNKFVLAYFDIDNFKIINDNYGHIFGDVLLIEISKRMRRILPENCTLARVGEDAFAFMLYSGFSSTQPKATFNLIMDQICQPFVIDKKEIFLTISMGISKYPEDGIKAADVVLAADNAMNTAKLAGKNRYCFFNQTMKEKSVRHMNIVKELRGAIANDEFYLCFQPQMEVSNLKIRGFEALIRWQNPNLGAVSPSEFIKTAEETGYIKEIGEWTLENACRYIKQINEKHGKDYVVSVNVSPAELKHPNYLKNFIKIIDKTEVNKNWLEIEITENVFIASSNRIIKTLYKIKELGFKLSLDDFGTGYSSLSYLLEMPIDILKIDQAFVKNFYKNSQSEEMVKTIIYMARRFKFQVIAEGVETQQQYDMLKRLKCNYIQGYLISRPIKCHKMEEFLSDKFELIKKGFLDNSE